MEENVKPLRVPAGRVLLYRVPEVAQLLGLGRTATYNLVRSGELPACHIGKSVRVKAADVEAFVAALGQHDDTVA